MDVYKDLIVGISFSNFHFRISPYFIKLIFLPWVPFQCYKVSEIFSPIYPNLRVYMLLLLEDVNM